VSDHPPKPPLALNVGVVGHRPGRLPAEARDRIRADIDTVLDGITAAMHKAWHDYADVFSDRAVLSLVDSLAEGADRIAAQAFLARAGAGDGSIGFALDVVLPFTAEEFEKDFAEEASREEFRTLTARARALLELPGQRDAEAGAYEAAAYTVIDQSDVVIAIWDGGPSGGRGGTTDTVEAAVRDGRPLIVIDANGKAPPHLRWCGLDAAAVPTGRIADVPAGDLETGLPRLADALLRPPAPLAEDADRKHHEDERSSLTRYFAEAAPGRTLVVGFPLLMAVSGVQGLSRRHVRPDGPAALAEREAAFVPAAAADAPAASRPRLLVGAFGWADFVGSLFAQVFRGAFILNFVFGALAVACAAISFVRHDWKLVLVTIEIALIAIVVLNTWLGLKRQWHRRWFEGRELAERLRVALVLWIVGLRPQGPAGAEPTWTGWYVRAVVRAQGLRHGRLIGEELSAARAAVTGILNDQCRYHELTSGRMHALERRLEWAGLAFFGLTIVAALAYIAVRLPNLVGGIGGMNGSIEEHGSHAAAEDFGVLVAALSAGLPALATATYGIRVIGDFAGISRRSHRTHEGLAAIARRIEADAPNLHSLRARVRAAAEVMLGDVAGWRLSAESRGLAIPG